MDMLTEKKVSYETLLLDPNNPRLFEEGDAESRMTAEEKQDSLTLSHLGPKRILRILQTS